MTAVRTLDKIRKLWKDKSVMVEDPRFTEPTIVVSEQEFRCPYCNRFHFKGSLAPGSAIEIKCHRSRCKKTFRFERK